MTPSGLTVKIIGNSALVLATIITGIILHRTGRPYNGLIFTIHKLVTIAFVILIARILIVHIHSHGTTALFLTLLVLSALSVIILAFSGGAMSLDKMYNSMLIVHRIATAIFIVCIAGIFYTIL